MALLRQIERVSERSRGGFSKRDSEAGVAAFIQRSPSVEISEFVRPWMGVAGCIGRGGEASKKLVVIGRHQSAEKLHVVEEEPVRRVTGDRQTVIHRAADLRQVMDDPEAICLIDDVLGVAAVGDEIELAPPKRDGLHIQIEPPRLADDVERKVVASDRLPKIGGLSSARRLDAQAVENCIIVAMQILIPEIADPAGQFSKRSDEREIGFADSHRFSPKRSGWVKAYTTP